MLIKQLFSPLMIATVLFACQEKSSSTWTTIKLKQNAPSMVHLNLGDSSEGHGDGMAFEASLRDTAGNEVGEVLGWLITVDLLDGDSLNKIYKTDKFGSMVIKLGDDEIIAQGRTYYSQDQKLMKSGVPQRRAIVGGTGKYKGVTGQITTTRNEDGTYTHELEVKMDE
ncbi:MAG: hypothetical protein RIQ50_1521 [Bacteroidota bacterium]|jgi:hypothetical protein